MRQRDDYFARRCTVRLRACVERVARADDHEAGNAINAAGQPSPLIISFLQ